MNQLALYSTIAKAGYKILMFEDHPQFFGNWRANVERNRLVYEIVSDHRDGWLSLWLYEAEGQRKLFETRLSTLGQEQELTQVAEWLASAQT